jgi:hypothetical protein
VGCGLTSGIWFAVMLVRVLQDDILIIGLLCDGRRHRFIG